jgi:hypothetical protein
MCLDNIHRLVYVLKANIRTTTVSEQRLGKQVPAATNTQAAIEELGLLCGPFQEVRKRTKRIAGNARVEAGSSTSTVAVRVVGGDEKGTLCLGDINTGT